MKIIIVYFSIFLFPFNAGPQKTSLYFEICEERDAVFENINVRKGFLELWLASGTNLPINQRSEQGGWIVTTGNNSYDVIPFPSDWPTSPCEISLPADYLEAIPPGLVGVVHTHPFYAGEDTTAPDVCGGDATDSYRSGGNHYDLAFLLEIANYLREFCIKGYVIDGNHIVSMTTWGKETFYPVNSFFRSIPDAL